jgi:hypothetical protein
MKAPHLGIGTIAHGRDPFKRHVPQKAAPSKMLIQNSDQSQLAWGNKRPAQERCSCSSASELWRAKGIARQRSAVD